MFITSAAGAGLVGAGQDTNDAPQLFSAAADTAVY